MESTSLECEDVVLYLTDYSRGYLSQREAKQIEEHLKECRNCRQENETLKELSIKIDKLIPVVSKSYEKDFIYRLFINSKPEPLFFKIASVLLIGGMLTFMVSALFTPKTEFTTLKELTYRAQNMFNEDYYSDHTNR